jgi:hypothetical protein
VTKAAVENDTEVFYAVRVEPRTGERIPANHTGTRQAIQRDGFVVDPASQAFCPHQWIDGRGYLDLNLAALHPLPHRG